MQVYYWQITLLGIETIQQIATKNSPAFSIFTCALSQDISRQNIVVVCLRLSEFFWGHVKRFLDEHICLLGYVLFIVVYNNA